MVKMEHPSYRNRTKKSLTLIVIVLFVSIIISFYSICISSYPISFETAIDIIWKNINGFKFQTYVDRLESSIIWDSHLPMAIGALTVGGIMGVGGSVMQTIIRNPVADPYTTGISSGALFGVTIFIILGAGFTGIGYELGMMINAFFFSMIPVAIIVVFSIFRKVTPTVMVLIGIAVMYVFSAMTTLLKFTASDDEISTIYAWSVGTLGGVGWQDASVLLLAFAFALVASMLLANKLNLLTTGDESTRSLGENPTTIRLLCLLIISVSTSIAVCFTGTIGFIGLISPHISRVLVGSNAKLLIPCSAVICGLLLIVSESLARCIGPTGMSVGVVTAMIGGPLFLYFIVKQKKDTW